MGPYLKLLLLTTYQAQQESTQSKTGPRESQWRESETTKPKKVVLEKIS